MNKHNSTISFNLPKGASVPAELEFSVTQELIDEAMAKGWTGCELYAEAVRRAIPEATDIEVRAGGKVGRRIGLKQKTTSDGDPIN